ncbi:MAG TPA: DUF302 domain-containing protein [Ktedonobacterales bacterium]|nr:DUF302 domain-containing protein [Ktedonobacterales bacterium]
MANTRSYGFGIDLHLPYDQALSAVTEALKAEGFGVLTTIDMQGALREKLGVEIEPYMILGACNPPLAHRALGAEQDIGLLLPCNVVVRAAETGSRVDFADPEAMMSIVGNDALAGVASEARQRLQRVAEALAARAATS